MHLRPITRKTPRMAFGVNELSILFNLVIQFFQVLNTIEDFLGVDFVDDFMKQNGEA